MENKDKVLVLVDADGLVYHSSKETLEESIQVLNDKIQNIYKKTEATHAALFISKGRYFRHNLDPLYKQNRGKYPTKLLWLKTLKAYLEENYQANSMNLAEADDLIALNYNRKFIYLKESDQVCAKEDCANINMLANSEEVKVIISSPDKDLLQSIEGKHFNYTYKLEEKNNSESVIKGWWVETSEKEAEYFRWLQLLMGDATDGISGLPGIGIKRAEEMLNWAVNNNRDFPEYVLTRYISHHHSVSKGIYEFQKNYRLLHLLENAEDFNKEIGELPQLPRIIEINKEITTTETTAMESSELNELFN